MIEKLTLYRSFAEVAREGSISAAAKNLYVTQPAVSADIRELEEALGTALFFRTNRGMKLTAEGQTLLDYVRKAFGFLESGEAALSDIADMRRGVLRIGASDMTLRFYLLDILADFCRDFPAVKIGVTNNPTPKTVEALRAGEIDFGVISGSADAFRADADLVTVPVRRIRDIFVAAPAHPLAARRGITPAELAATPLIMLEKKTGTRRYLATLPGYRELTADIELATSDLIVEFAKRGLAAASVVANFAAEALERGELCELDLADPPPERYFLAVYRRGMPHSAAVREMFARMGLCGSTGDENHARVPRDSMERGKK